MTDVRRLVSRAATAVRTAGGRLAGGRTRSEHFVPDAWTWPRPSRPGTPSVHHLIRYQWAVTAPAAARSSGCSMWPAARATAPTSWPACSPTPK